MTAQVERKSSKRGGTRAPDLGWPTRPWYGDLERVVGGAVVALLLLALLLALVVSGGSSPTGAPAPVVSDGAGVAATSPSVPAATRTATAAAAPADTRWYSDTATVRDQLTDSGQLVRRHVEAADGVALEPECARLGDLVGDARAVRAAVEPATAELWSDVVDGYADAATACGQLFDGTQIEVAVLLDRTTVALDDAERASTALDESFAGA